MANLFGSGGGIPGPLENFAIGGDLLGQAGASAMGLRSPEQQRSEAIAEIRSAALGQASNEQEFLQMMGKGLVQAGLQEESFAILDRLRQVQGDESDIQKTVAESAGELAGARKDLATASLTTEEQALIGPKGSLLEADARLRDSQRRETEAKTFKIQKERDKIAVEIEDILNPKTDAPEMVSFSDARGQLLMASVAAEARLQDVPIPPNPTVADLEKALSQMTKASRQTVLDAVKPMDNAMSVFGKQLAEQKGFGLSEGVADTAGGADDDIEFLN